MSIFHLPVVPAPSNDPGTVPSSIADRFDAVDERLLTMEERLDLILQRGKGLLDEIVKLGRKVDTVVAENRAAAEERAR